MLQGLPNCWNDGLNRPTKEALKISVAWSSTQVGRVGKHCAYSLHKSKNYN